MNSKNSLYIKIGLVAGLALGLGAGTYYVINKSPLNTTPQEVSEPEVVPDTPQAPTMEQPAEQPAQEPVPQPTEQVTTTAKIEKIAQEKPKPQPQKKPRKQETKLPPLPFMPESRPPVCTHELGFKSLKEELSNQKLEVRGTIPAWLHGTFISIGPAIFEIGESKAIHWLDGLGMVYAFTIDGKSIIYNNKIIESEYCKDCIAKGKLRGSVPEQKKSTWAKLTSAVSSAARPVYDNVNINVACFNKQLVALTETPYPICLDTTTMQTTGKFEFTDNLEAQFSSAHPLFDPTTQEWYGVGIHFAHNSNYIVYKMSKEGTQRKVIASIPVGYPTYLHSFAMTPNYIIITEPPFTVSPYDLLLSDNSFIENFNWKPKNGTRFIVINKKTGKKEGIYKTEAFFTLHHVNAFEQDGKIIVDLIAFKDPQVTRSFSYENICNPHLQLPHAHIKRFELNRENEQVTVHTLSPHNIELPNINPGKLMHEYRYVYVTGSERGFAQTILKLDLKSKRHAQWHEANVYPTEAVFVPRPGSTEEDDGVVISLALDAFNKKSFLLILDGKTLAELARAYVPHAIPFTSHSTFFKK